MSLNWSLWVHCRLFGNHPRSRQRLTKKNKKCGADSGSFSLLDTQLWPHNLVKWTFRHDFFLVVLLIMSHWSKKTMPKHKTWKSSWHFLVSAKDPFKLYISTKNFPPRKSLGGTWKPPFFGGGSINQLLGPPSTPHLHGGASSWRSVPACVGKTCPFLWAGELEVGTWLFYGFPKIEKHQGD